LHLKWATCQTYLTVLYVVNNRLSLTRQSQL